MGKPLKAKCGKNSDILVISGYSDLTLIGAPPLAAWASPGSTLTNEMKWKI